MNTKIIVSTDPAKIALGIRKDILKPGCFNFLLGFVSIHFKELVWTILKK